MRDKKVKIIATIGPASDSLETIDALAREGVDVFRINLSHSAKDYVHKVVTNIREVEKKHKRPLTIMGDLAGPKIRIGDVEEGVELVRGEIIKIYRDTVVGNAAGFSLNRKEIIDALKPEAEVFIDDGNLKLVVEEKINEGVLARVVVGGILKPRKGFSAEGLSVSSTGLSAKDKGDIALMLEEGTDALAVSFVQNAKDIEAVKEQLPKNSQIMLIAKIETKAGIENAEEILKVADGLMVARGDMGLAIPIAEVPHIQKELINLCLKYEKPVITATQMLESMVNTPMPTRAEVTDVANAILDGTDAVMLSAETASGKFPVETVHMMVKIIYEALHHTTTREFNDEKGIGSAVSGSVGWIADRIGADLVIAFTESGRCARRISRTRHPQTIIALSPNQHTIHNLNFSWGVHPTFITSTKNFDDMREQAKDFAKKNDITRLEKGDPFVIAAGLPFGESGTTNMVFVEKA